MNLSQNFRLAEFTESDTAIRLGIDNEPRSDVIIELTKLAEVLELIRAALNDAVPGTFIAVTSGYRCEALERVITEKDFRAWCGRRTYDVTEVAWKEYFARKAHPKGHGVDWKAPKFGTPLEIVRFISTRPEIMRHIDQIIMEGNWVHVGISDNPRHMVMSATFKDGTPVYTTGIEK